MKEGKGITDKPMGDSNIYMSKTTGIMFQASENT
jgi:hypothetical protein